MESSGSDALSTPPRRSIQGHFEFACFVSVEPANVWSALTTPCSTGRYLYGLAAQSSWQVGAPILFDTATDYELIGRVLHVEQPHRLTYLLQAGPDDPCTYLTWQVRSIAGGSTVALHVDEIDCDLQQDEAENIWLPVLAALQNLLATSDRSDATTPDPAIGEPG
jgi:uncharacterized protein YndB with AHSA1/START domain